MTVHLTPHEAMMEIKLERLTKERDELREALKFYGHPMNWRVDGTFMPASPDSDRRPDCGDTARKALANLNKTDGE